MSKKIVIGIGILIIVVLAALGLKSRFTTSKPAALVTPTPAFAEQLPPEKHPKVKLVFSSDAHYVTVDISSLYADQLEYNLIYDATVKKSQIQTGVNAQANVSGQSTYSKKQLLGSESSGKFTYHTNIQNAVLELILRDSSGRSLFTSTYPFTVSPSRSVDLTPQ